MTELRFAMFGAGFWAPFQLTGWREAGGVRCVALYNRTRAKAEELARRLEIPAVYDDPEGLLEGEELDFVDVCTNVETHARFVRLAADRGLPVVCQKPMATSIEKAEEMVAYCREAGVAFYINENWRWQRPIREFKRILNHGRIGAPFRARIEYCNSFPVFETQPFLKEIEQFILTDIGSHILDTARFLFGEAHSLSCLTNQVTPGIKGEDVATVMMRMGEDVTVTCEMSYASRTEHERFPQTYIFVEGSRGSLELNVDFWIRETTEAGTLAKRYPPERKTWAEPPCYDLTHDAIVLCQKNLSRALRGEEEAETTGEDNLNTMRLVFGAYESARSRRTLRL